MQWLLAGAAAHLAAWVLGAFAFRCVPFVVYALVSKGVAWDMKLAGALFFTAVLLAAGALGVALQPVVVHAPLALAYFAALSVGLYACQPWTRRAPAAVSFALAMTGYVLLPALVVPGAAVVPAVVVGWEAMMSAYSLHQDTKRSEIRPGLRECLFFILVNPALVYAERGTKIDSEDLAGGTLRCLLGLCTWAVQAFLAIGASAWLTPDSTGSTARGQLLLLFWINAAVFYLGHSGLASVQIGMMRAAGWRIPERYNYPFLATSPAQFWRRWNIYVGSWARRYLFVPWAMRLGRTRRLGNATAKGIAALGTFAAIGALHAVIQYIAVRAGEPRRWGPLDVMAIFLAFGVVFVVWEGIAQHKAVLRLARMRLRRARLLAAWVLFSSLMATMIWLVLIPRG